MEKTRTRFSSLLLALAMTLGLLQGRAWGTAGTLSGSGTAEDPYLIADAEDLKAFRDLVNTADSNAAYAKLTADIDLQNEEWTPINSSSGYATTAYAGTFDGDGHTISGLSINATATNQGLFAVINGATIRNLMVEGKVYSSKAYVGGIVGKIQQGTIENCGFSGNVKTGATGSSAYAGGITGYAGNSSSQTAAITGCVNTATVTGGVSGGIAGYAKYVTIENCYNTGNISGTSRAGGIAGQLQNVCVASNCYNVGETSGSSTAADICDFLYTSATLDRCYYQKQASGEGTGKINTCEQITDADTLLEKLGSAFAADTNNINGGWPILAWQAGASPAPKDPHITLTGSTTLYQTNNGVQPAATLRVNYVDLDDEPTVTWSILSGQDVVELVTPDAPEGNNAIIIVQALTPGYAAVQAQAGDYTVQTEIAVYPFVTTVEIEGTVAAGQTVRARVNVLGGGEYDYDYFPTLKFQWKYLTEADYVSGNTANYREIPGAGSREFLIPEELVGAYLSFTIPYNGENKSPNITSKVLANAPEKEPDTSQTEDPNDDLAAAAAALGEWYKMYPVCGTDTNVTDMLERDLADQGFECIEATVKSVEEVYGGAGIASNGDITYFYADPNTAPTIRMGSYKVTFTLTKGNVSLDCEDISVLVYWDVVRVKETMQSEILSQVTVDTETPVTSELSLPKAVDGKLWTLISWTSSNENVISISGENQSTADTLFAPYIGVVKQGTEEQTVTLTAKFTFQLTNDVTGGEAPIVLYKAFTVTVPPLDENRAEEIRQGLLDKLDQGFTAKGLTDAATGERLTADGYGRYTAIHDIQLPTTRDFGVDGKYDPVTITSDNDETVKAPDVNNAARVEVYRPGVGQADGQATITVTLADRDTNVTASKTFLIKVPALTQTEIDGELALMERVKGAYFDGIKGDNTTRDDVRTDLTPFQEVYEDEGGKLVWVRNAADQTGCGIVPTPIDGWEDLELWRLFKSSNPNVISHENLLVTRQQEAKAVTVTSYLSSETLGRYGALYREDSVKYAQYAALEGLYYQEVTTDATTQPKGGKAAFLSANDTIVVRGLNTPDSAIPVAETMNVTFMLTGLDGEVWIPPTTFSNLDETFTVYDAFTRALTDNGYTATRQRGTYIVSVSGAQGTLTEKEYGDHSGWMYRVNGEIPDVYMGACPLYDGDSIQVFYTRDASVDDPDWSWPGSDAPEGTAPPADSEQPAPSGSGSSGGPGATRPSAEEESISTGQAIVPASRLFDDVTEGSWYESGVTFVVEHDLFQGVADNRFAPEVNMSRAMLVTVLARLDGQDTDGSGSWYQAGMDWAMEKGVSDGTDPDADVTREQLAVMLYRYAQLLDLPTAGRDSLRSFTDSDQVSDWARDAVAWAVDSEIINGRSDDTLAPSASATRAEAATMLQRFVEFLLK